MKVLKKGRKQKGWSTEANCTGHGNGGGGCGAKLLIEESDLYFTFSHARDETERHVTFTCCECGVETDLRDVPGQIQHRLPEKAGWVRLDGHDSLEGNRG